MPHAIQTCPVKAVVNNLAINSLVNESPTMFESEFCRLATLYYSGSYDRSVKEAILQAAANYLKKDRVLRPRILQVTCSPPPPSLPSPAPTSCSGPSGRRSFRARRPAWQEGVASTCLEPSDGGPAGAHQAGFRAAGTRLGWLG